MERYLLFDSGCSLCTSLARQVEEVADSRLVARSLRDPDVRLILDEAKPGWSWEPMLLEVDGERRRVYAGIGMRARLVRVFGPWWALRLARIIQRATVFQPDRRGVLKLAGGLLAGLTLSGWMSGSVKAGDGPEVEPTTKVFLPFLQSNPLPSDTKAADATKALTLLLNSAKLAAFRAGDKQRGMAFTDKTQQLLPIVLSEGQTIYGAENQAVIFAGEKEEHRLFQVFLGATVSKERTRNSEYDVVWMGIVDISTDQVLDIYQFDVSAGEGEITLKLQTSSGRIAEYAERNNEIVVIKDNQSLLRIDWCSWWASVLCATGGGLACLTTCGALCYVTAGLACASCSIICWSIFTGICATAHC